MLSKNFNDTLPLLLAVLVVFILVLGIDLILLIRWLRYRIQLQSWYGSAPNALTTESGVIAEPAAVPIEQEEAAAQTEEAAETKGETVAPPPHDAQPRPPFAARWSLVDPFLGFQAVVLLANLVPLIPYIGYLFVTGAILSSNRLTTATERSIPYFLIFGTLLQNALFVGVPAYYLRRYGTSLKEVGLRRPTVRLILLGLALGVGLLLLSNFAEQGLELLLKHLLPRNSLANLKKMGESFDAEVLFKQLHSLWLKALFVLMGAVAAPIGEEVFFRGFLYNTLKQRYTMVVGIVFSALAWALIHLSPLNVLIIFPMGMILAYVYERTRSLWVTIIMHAVNNGVVFALLWANPKLGS